MVAVRAVGLATALAAALAVTAPPSAALRAASSVATPTDAAVSTALGSTDATAPLVGALALAAWAALAWLAAVAVLTALAAHGGRFARPARACLRRAAPAAVRQAVALALGVAVAVGGSAPALAASPVGEPSVPSLDWPGSRPPASTGVDRLAAAGAAPGAARSEDTAPPPPGGTSAPVPASTPIEDTAPPPPATTGGTAARGAGVPAAWGADRVVVVASGDSLWALAARELAQDGGPSPSAAAVASRWPAWWAANREAVGPDPDVIHPGTALQRPDPS